MSQVLTSFQAREPGLRVLPPNMERYTVRGNYLIMLSLKAGDSIEVVNLEGKQKCELIVFDKNGKENSAILGLKSKAPFVDGKQPKTENKGDCSRSVCHWPNSLC